MEISLPLAFFFVLENLISEQRGEGKTDFYSLHSNFSHVQNSLLVCWKRSPLVPFSTLLFNEVRKVWLWETWSGMPFLPREPECRLCNDLDSERWFIRLQEKRVKLAQLWGTFSFWHSRKIILCYPIPAWAPHDISLLLHQFNQQIVTKHFFWCQGIARCLKSLNYSG